MRDDFYKEYKHNPPHLFRPETKYFITGSTYLGKTFLKGDRSKMALLESLKIGFTKRKWVIEDWVILDNHYHLMVNSPEDSSSLGDIIKEVHRFNALWIKKNIEVLNDDAIWYNYWDTCITYEKSYYCRLNYIWFNPVKHGYVENPEDWIHGSYYLRIKNEKEYLNTIKEKYPFDRLKIDDDY
jgi:putative transposase